MITVGFSTRKIDQSYIDYIRKTCGNKGIQVIAVENNGEYSLTQVYNKILNESENDIVVFCHDDLKFDTTGWMYKIESHFQKNPDYGIIGLAGTKFMPISGRWWEIQTAMYGIVNHESNGKKWESKYSKDIGNKIEPTIIVDGLFFAVNKKNIIENFDESVEGFHFYDIDFCFRNYLKFVKIGVCTNIRVTHLSIGETNEQWEINRNNFSEKFSEKLPIDITDAENYVKTFIFIHDQDLLLEFERIKKFIGFNNYKYVFVGNRPIDKLQELSNVIISRNYEDNLEDYPQLTSFTGWYTLWKNNLIDSEYVNLFEYDINYVPDFETNLHKFYYEKSEMIGYIPFPAHHNMFVRHKPFIQGLFDAIKRVYGMDISKTVNDAIDTKSITNWSSTSNTTFRKDVFEKYMEWFLPLVNLIKDDRNAGHYHERSITLFSMMNKKKFLLTANFIKHFQMDSHKTQGHKVDNELTMQKINNKRNVMSKYVSFSLWGANPVYCVGAIKNAMMMPQTYPGWKMVVFYDKSVPVNIINKLNELNVITIDATSFEIYGMFWRFFAYSIDDCEYVVFRDTDSRISDREFLAVEEWIRSGKTIHVMRDHPAHRIPYGNDKPGILGGMWGIKRFNYNLTTSIVYFVENKNLGYGSDQTFLADIYNMFQHDMMIHDEFFGGNPFPLKRTDKRFIGERINIDEQPLTNDWMQNTLKMKNTLGIAIPTYKNHVGYLQQLLDTIKCSTVLPDVVSIACSNMDEELKLNEYPFEIILDTTNEKRNASQNRNIAGSKLDTDIISFMDGDDLPHIKRNEYLLKYFESYNNPVVHNYHKSKVRDLSLIKDNVGDLIVKDKIVDTVMSSCHTPISSSVKPIIFHNAHISLLRKDFDRFKFDESKKFERIEDSMYNQELIKNKVLISYIENKLSVYFK